MQGRFITLEGVEGAGKSTQAETIRALLTARGQDVLLTREPGGTPLAEDVRSLLLAERQERVEPLAEALLIFAARAQHLEAVIRPALRAGRWVLCDRFTDSTFAYQGGGRGIDSKLLTRLAALVHGDCWPQLTLYLDVPVETGMRRIAGRDRDRIEREDLAFFERVRHAYRSLARAHCRVVEVDANRPLPVVQENVRRIVRRYLAEQSQ